VPFVGLGRQEAANAAWIARLGTSPRANEMVPNLERGPPECPAVRLERYGALVNACPMATMVLARDARIELSNVLMHDLVGLPGALVTGHTFTRFVTPASVDPLRAALASVFAAPSAEPGPIASSTRVTRPDGTEIPVEILLARQAANDDELCLAIVHQKRPMPPAHGVARRALPAGLTHELRTALNALLGSAQLLVRESEHPLRARQLARVERILAGGRHMTHLLDEVSAFSDPESWRAPVALSEVVAAVVENLSSLAAAHEITIETQGIEDAPDVYADRATLLRVLENLGSNVVTYNRRGGSVRFLVTTGDSTRVAVVDAGLGIPFDHQMRIVRALEGPADHSTHIQGAALGLTIAQRLIRLMQGSLGFTMVPGEPSAFWLELPTASRPTEGGPA